MSSSHKQQRMRWNNSGELDVFEATKYFAGAIDGLGFAGIKCSDKAKVVENMVVFPEELKLKIHEKEKLIIRDKKFKPPSSPFSRLTRFLSSFFQQNAASRKITRATKPIIYKSPAMVAKDRGKDDRMNAMNRSGSIGSAGFRNHHIYNSNPRSISSSCCGSEATEWLVERDRRSDAIYQKLAEGDRRRDAIYQKFNIIRQSDGQMLSRFRVTFADEQLKHEESDVESDSSSDLFELSELRID